MSDTVRLFSRKNVVILRGGVVEKRVASAEAAQAEAQTLKRLRACGVRVPLVLRGDGATLVMEYVSGVTLPEFLEVRRNDAELKRAADAIVEWLAEFYRSVSWETSGTIRGDVNGRNFLVSHSGEVWGVDFEEHAAGPREEDAGRLLAFCETYRVADRDAQMRFVVYLEQHFIDILRLDAVKMAEYRADELAAMAIRRKKT